MGLRGGKPKTILASQLIIPSKEVFSAAPAQVPGTVRSGLGPVFSPRTGWVSWELCRTTTERKESSFSEDGICVHTEDQLTVTNG